MCEREWRVECNAFVGARVAAKPNSGCERKPTVSVMPPSSTIRDETDWLVKRKMTIASDRAASMPTTTMEIFSK